MIKMMIIDGIDGTGKSTLVEQLAQEYPDIKSHNFPTKLPQGEQKADLTARSLYHLQDFQLEVSRRLGHPGVLVFDRSFITTLSYQGFGKGYLKDPMRYDAIYKLGAEAFFGITRLGAVKSTRMECSIVQLTCDPNNASDRVEARLAAEMQQGTRPDEIEALSKFHRVSHLRRLQKRYEIIRGDLVSSLPTYYPDVKFNFWTIDTTEKSPEEVFEAGNNILSELVDGQVSLL